MTCPTDELCRNRQLGSSGPSSGSQPGEEPIRPVGRPETPTACAHSMMTITIRFTSTPMGVVEGSTVGFLHHEDGHRVAHFLYENPDLYRRAACRALVAGWMGSRREDVGMFGVTLFMPDAAFEQD